MDPYCTNRRLILGGSKRSTEPIDRQEVERLNLVLTDGLVGRDPFERFPVALETYADRVSRTRSRSTPPSSRCDALSVYQDTNGVGTLFGAMARRRPAMGRASPCRTPDAYCAQPGPCRAAARIYRRCATPVTDFDVTGRRFHALRSRRGKGKDDVDLGVGPWRKGAACRNPARRIVVEHPDPASSHPPH